MFNPFSIEGKTILITGAASGMGKATAIACAKMGAKVVGADFNEEGLSKTLSELEGEDHQSFVVNLAEENTWTDLLTNAPVFDGIANCAGIANMNPFMFVNRDEFDKVFNINFFGPVLLTKSIIKQRNSIREAPSCSWLRRTAILLFTQGTPCILQVRVLL